MGWGWAEDLWDTVTDGAETVWDAVTTGVGAIVDTIEILLWPASVVLAFVIGALESIPIVGAFIEWVINITTTIIWYVVGAIDFVLALLGILPEKRMRVHVVVLIDNKGVPMATDVEVINAMSVFQQTFKDRANVRILPVGIAKYTSAFADIKPPDASWISYYQVESNDLLIGECDWDGVKADWGSDGNLINIQTKLQIKANFIRSLLGYGAPTVIFVIKKFSDPSKAGCSLGPVRDYVQVEGSALTIGPNGLTNNVYLIPHECGHACNLTHSYFDGNSFETYALSNLMNPDGARGNELTKWQVAVLRGSRRVSYF